MNTVSRQQYEQDMTLAIKEQVIRLCEDRIGQVIAIQKQLYDRNEPLTDVQVEALLDHNDEEFFELLFPSAQEAFREGVWSTLDANHLTYGELETIYAHYEARDDDLTSEERRRKEWVRIEIQKLDDEYTHGPWRLRDHSEAEQQQSLDRLRRLGVVDDTFVTRVQREREEAAEAS